jgi:hypothetical protein
MKSLEISAKHFSNKHPWFQNMVKDTVRNGMEKRPNYHRLWIAFLLAALEISISFSNKEFEVTQHLKRLGT